MDLKTKTKTKTMENLFQKLYSYFEPASYCVVFKSNGRPTAVVSNFESIEQASLWIEEHEQKGGGLFKSYSGGTVAIKDQNTEEIKEVRSI